MKTLVSSLALYPIKSCAGILTDYLEISETGPSVRWGSSQILHDRMFMFVGADGEFKTQRTHPKLSLIIPRVSASQFTIEVNGSQYEIPMDLLQKKSHRQKVKIFGKEFSSPVCEGDFSKAVSQFLGEEVFLSFCDSSVHREVVVKNQGLGIETKWTDGQQWLVISDESLTDLNKKLKTPLLRDRFRANIWIQGTYPYREDQMTEISTDDYSLESTKACSRCKIITVNQALGTIEDSEPLQALTQFRKRDNQVFFGQYFKSLSHGSIVRLGDILNCKYLSQ